MTEGVPQYAGVIVFNMSNVPLGFGIASHATEICRTLPPTSHVVLHQADVGEYLRQEDTLNDNVSSFAAGNRIHFIIVAKDRNCYYYASSPNHTSYDYKNI